MGGDSFRAQIVPSISLPLPSIFMLELPFGISHYQENGLLSFSWDLGIYIPTHIFGSKGYLTTKHTALKSLSVILIILTILRDSTMRAAWTKFDIVFACSILPPSPLNTRRSFVTG